MFWFNVISAGICGGLASMLALFLIGRPAKKNKKKAFAYVATVLVLFFVFKSLIPTDSMRDSFLSSFDREYIVRKRFAESFVKISHIPEVKDYLQSFSIKNRTNIRTLVTLGMKRLDYQRLITWNDLRLKLSQKSPKLCAAFWYGNVQADDFVKALAGLSDEEINNATNIITQAAKLESAKQEYIPASPDHYSSAISILAMQYPENERAEYLRVLKLGPNANSMEACAGTNFLLNNGRLEAGSREKFLRFLYARY